MVLRELTGSCSAGRRTFWFKEELVSSAELPLEKKILPRSVLDLGFFSLGTNCMESSSLAFGVGECET